MQGYVPPCWIFFFSPCNGEMMLLLICVRRFEIVPCICFIKYHINYGGGLSFIFHFGDSFSSFFPPLRSYSELLIFWCRLGKFIQIKIQTTLKWLKDFRLLHPDKNLLIFSLQKNSGFGFQYYRNNKESTNINFLILILFPLLQCCGMTYFTQILASFLQLLFQKVLLDQANSQTQHCIVLNLIMIALF